MSETVTIEAPAESSPIASPSNSPSPITSPRPTTTPIPSPSVSPSPSPTLELVTNQQINEYIDRYAAEYGVDGNILRHIAICESGLDPTIEHLSYVGLFQFGPKTWENKRLEMGRDPSDALRWVAQEQVITAAWIIKMGYTNIWPNCIP